MTMKKVLGRILVADNMAALFDWRARQAPDRVFIRFEDESATYRELDQMAERIQTAFRSESLQPSDRIACFMYNSLWHVAIMIACARSGLLWAPINVSLGEDDLSYTLEDLQPSLLFLDNDLLDSYCATETYAAPRVVIVGRDPKPLTGSKQSLDQWLPAKADELPDISISAADPFAIIYSGGTTGRPKGVILPHFAAVSCGIRMSEVAKFEDDEVFFSSSHLFHALLPCGVIPLCLLKGWTFCFTRWWSASRYLGDVRKFKPTLVDPFIGMVATLLRQPETADDMNNSIRLSISGYGGMDEKSLQIREAYERRFGLRTLQPYGQTEAGGFITTEIESEPAKRGASGKLRGWFDLLIADEDGLPLPMNQVGQIMVRPKAPSMMAHGYLGRPQESLNSWRDLWVHTGDQGYLDEDGDLFFVGRQGHFLRKSGELVAVAELEQVIAQLEGISEVAVVAVPSELGEDDIKCGVVWDEATRVAYDPRLIVDF